MKSRNPRNPRGLPFLALVLAIAASPLAHAKTSARPVNRGDVEYGNADGTMDPASEESTTAPKMEFTPLPGPAPQVGVEGVGPITVPAQAPTGAVAPQLAPPPPPAPDKVLSYDQVIAQTVQSLAGLRCPSFEGIAPKSVKDAFTKLLGDPVAIESLKARIGDASGKQVELQDWTGEGFTKEAPTASGKYFILADKMSDVRMAVSPLERPFTCETRMIMPGVYRSRDTGAQGAASDRPVPAKQPWHLPASSTHKTTAQPAN